MQASITRIAIGTGLILLIPLVAMQFTNEVNWNVTDFVVAGMLLMATGLALDFSVRRFSNTVYRIIAVIIVAAIFFLIWAELAVGIFGTPWASS